MLVSLTGAAEALTATTTTLAISSTSVPYKTPITLTATVTAGGSPVTTGLVMFCDADAAYCENNSALLASVQLTASTGTATVKIGSGPLGIHSYKAVYRANSTYDTSTSGTVSYTVAGTYETSTNLASSGTVGSYNLSSTVTGVGAITSPGPSGSVNFVDVSAGNLNLGTQNLGTPTLTNTFSQAANSPFSIGNSETTVRSVTIASAYLDGDNNIDVVTGDSNNIITVLLGNGDGTFQAKTNYPGCPVIGGDQNQAYSILLADFNRDGNTDIVLGCSNQSQGGVAVLLGTGTGAFQAPLWYQTGDVTGLALGDFNNDGFLDLAVANRIQKTVRILLGDGGGNFSPPSTVLDANNYPRNIVVADFNSDGKDDLAFGIDSNNSSLVDLYVMQGKGNGTFGSAVRQMTNIGEFLTSGDINGDNRPDIISVTLRLTTSSSTIAKAMFVLIGNGDSTFQPKATYTSDIPSDPHLADVNGDGKADIIAGGSYGTLVYRGNGDGTFQAFDEPLIGGFSRTYAVNAGDYNNDGNADLIGTDAATPRAAVALSQVSQGADAVALKGVAVLPKGSGIHNVDAVYSGDSIYITSTSSTVALRAEAVATTLALTSSPASTAALGQSVTLTATLSPYQVTGPPSTTTDGQSVTFYRGSTSLGTGTLSGGVATLTTTSLPSGALSLKAVFAGTTDYLSSTSSTLGLNVSSVSLASSLNPSSYGQAVTLTASVVSGATGTVQFYDGTTSLGTSTISGTSAVLSVSALTTGTHNLTAVYSGDSTHAIATSAVVEQKVNPINTNMSVAAKGTSTYLSMLTITATITTGASGKVHFTSGALQLGSAEISNGTAVITTNVLPVGQNTITADYDGDANYSGAKASTVRSVTQDTPSTALTSSVNPSPYGTSVTFTNTLTSTVTGKVTFTSNGTVLGTVSSSNGVATLTTKELGVGDPTIRAIYEGDTNYIGVTASMVQHVQKATPSLILTSSANPSIAGQAITLTATLPTDVTNSVTFKEGNVTLATVPVSNGVAAFSTSSLSVDSHEITATYSGDGYYETISKTLTQVVNRADTTVALVSSLNPSNYGDSVTLSVTITSAGGGTPTGNVTFWNGGTALATVALASGAASLTTANLPAGTLDIAATYDGSPSNNGSKSSLKQTVNKITPTLSLISSKNPATLGENVTLTATLNSSLSGSVTFEDEGVEIGKGTMSSGTATFQTSSLTVGDHSIKAIFSGDANHNMAEALLTQTISKKTPTVSVTTSGPSTYGQTVTITATVPSDASGTVSFTAGTSLGTATVNNGVATITTSSLPVGSIEITADYSGDNAYKPGSGNTKQVVSKATPTVTVTTSGPSTYGQTVTITATVPTDATGTVAFSVGSTSLGSATVAHGVASITTSTLPAGTSTIKAEYSGDTNYNTAEGTTTQTVAKGKTAMSLTTVSPSAYGQPVKITATLPSAASGNVSFSTPTGAIGTAAAANGVAAITTSTLPVGSYLITATYEGDGNYDTDSAQVQQKVNKLTTTTQVLSSLNPSQVNQNVTFTATISPAGTGKVTFKDGGNTLGIVDVASGAATLMTSKLTGGEHVITASYNGDSTYEASDGELHQTVNATTTTVTVVSSLNPSTYGQAVTFTATVPSGATGQVTFSSGSVEIGSGPVDLATGKVSVTTSTLPVGNNLITANYAGDNNYGQATGSTNQVVSKVTPTVTVTTSGPSTYGDVVTITATVPVGATGDVTFSSGSTAIGSGSVNATTGKVSVTTSTLPVGNNLITARYAGDSNYEWAMGTAKQEVSKVTPTVTVTTPGSSNFGDPVTITVTVPKGAEGSVTVISGGTTIGGGQVDPVTGTVTVTTSTLPIGNDLITANYGGDPNHNAGSGSTTQVVNKATPAVTLVSSLNPSTYGQAVTFTATVPSGATGQIVFRDGNATMGAAQLSGGQAAITISTLGAGTHILTATYDGDSSHNGGSSSPLSQVVSKINTVLPAPTVSDSNPNPNTPVTITEQVPAGVTGPITFSNGGTVLGTVPVVGGVATITVSSLPVGSNPITASVGETDNYTGATSPPTTVTVGKITTTVTLTSSLNPSTVGQGVRFIATVPTGVTGTITFTSDGVIIGTAPLTSFVAVLPVNNLTAGSHTILATYEGDSAHEPASSAPLNQVVQKATPTLPAPVVSSPTQIYGATQTITETVPTGVSGPVTFYNGSTVIGAAPLVNGVAILTVTTLPIGTNPITASTPGDANNNPATSPATIVTVIKTTPVLPAPTVSDANPNPNTPVTITEHVPSGVTGTVTFTNGGTVLGTAPIVDGVATLTVPSLPVGANPVIASVAETATSNAATSPATTVTVGLVTPTVTLSSSVNPAEYSQAVTFTASVPAGATGSITFSDGATVLGTGTVNAAGIATLTTSSLTIGTHPITASYGGNTEYKPAVSAALAQVVSKLPSTIMLSISSGTSFTQTSITLTATVATSVPTPTGTVTFLEGTTILGTAALNTNTVVGLQLTGNAALAISTLSSGSHSITAVYSGDATFLTSTSAPIAALVHDFTNKNTGTDNQEAFPGDTVNYKFTLTPVGTTTFLSDVKLSIDGLPSNATYTLTPTTVAGGAGATEVTLAIKTSTKLNTAANQPAGPASSPRTPIAFAMLGLLGMDAARRYRRRMPRLLLAALLAAGSLLPIASLAGCAGGYYAPKPTSYTITVTGTEGALVRSATATLIVEQ